MKYVYKSGLLRAIAGVYDAFGYRFRLHPRRDEPIDPLQIKKILIIRLDHLGDVLLSSYVPHELKKRYPNAQIYFLTSRVGAALLKECPDIDKIIIFDAPWFLRASGNHARQINIPRLLIEELRAIRIDLCISLRGDVRENCLTRRVGSQFSIGYGPTGGGFNLTHELTQETDVHETEHSLKILRVLGCTDLPDKSNIHERILSYCKQEKTKKGPKNANRVIGILLKSGASSKDWPKQHWLDFVHGLGRLGFSGQLHIYGTDSDPITLDTHKNGFSIQDKRGKTTVESLINELALCDIFIGPDSGPTHLAAYLGVPTIFLYSGTNEIKQWGNLSPNATHLLNPVPCVNCGQAKCPIPEHPCMQGISVDQLLSQMKNIL